MCSSIFCLPLRRPVPSVPSASSTPIQGFGFRFFRFVTASIPTSNLLCTHIISATLFLGNRFPLFVKKLKYFRNITREYYKVLLKIETALDFTEGHGIFYDVNTGQMRKRPAHEFETRIDIKGGTIMATYTGNYNLIKPGAEDYYDVEDFNSNMDTLDRVMAAAENELADIGGKMDTAQSGIDSINGKMDTAQSGIDSISSKIGTPPSGQSLVSMLQSGGSVIRSIQRVIYTTTTSPQNSGTVSIQPVNIGKTIVFSERLTNNYSNLINYSYTLNSDYISLSHDPAAANYLSLGFWVVEFV